MDEPPEIARLDDLLESMALDIETWRAFAHVLEAVDSRAKGFTLTSITEGYTIGEMTEMVRTGISFVQTALPEMNFTNRPAAVLAVQATMTALQCIAEQGAHYDLTETRRLAQREAYGL